MLRVVIIKKTRMETPNNVQRPKVGIGVIVINNGKVLLGKRKNAHGEGTWCYPGGHLEYGESFEDCAKREVMEETGLTIKNLRFGVVTNDIFDEQKHYITICMIADIDSGEVQLKEPEKCSEWAWFDWHHLPSPLFLPIIHQQSMGFTPFTQ